eukprot:SAG31_NODE_140_length_22731_cov_10.941410_25_plen_85_part_00
MTSSDVQIADDTYGCSVAESNTYPYVDSPVRPVPRYCKFSTSGGRRSMLMTRNFKLYHGTRTTNDNLLIIYKGKLIYHVPCVLI